MFSPLLAMISLKIYIMVCDEIPGNIPQLLAPVIEETYGVKTEIIKKEIEFENAFDGRRKQYFAPKILSEIERNAPNDSLRVLALIDKDIYDHSLNFIFGEAKGKVCLVSINRFKPCTYVDTKEEFEILFQRVLKTSIHELGHTFGLGHCLNNKCVMFFSNWIGDTDRKSHKFCRECFKQLREKKFGFR